MGVNYRETNLDDDEGGPKDRACETNMSIESTTLDGMSNKNPHGCHVVMSWMLTNEGPKTLRGYKF